VEKRSSIVGGMILIIVGALLLLVQFVPGLGDWFDIGRQWPLIIVLGGALFFLGALFGTPSLAIPAVIIGGTGLILYYQNATGNWGTWAYIWALYPGMVGVGILLMHGLSGKLRQGLRESMPLLMISAILFLIFSSFFNGWGLMGQLWPVFIIIGGLWLLWNSRQTSKGKK
jgi:hypothetical protein